MNPADGELLDYVGWLFVHAEHCARHPRCAACDTAATVRAELHGRLFRTISYTEQTLAYKRLTEQP